MSKNRWLQGTTGGAPWLIPKVERKLWKIRLGGKSGLDGRMEQVVNVDK